MIRIVWGDSDPHFALSCRDVPIPAPGKEPFMTPSTPAACTLAAAAAATAWRDVPDAARRMALGLTLDALAIVAGGAMHPDMERLVKKTGSGSDGAATVIARNRTAAMRDAIFLNAACTTVLQRQDGYANAKGHPASQMVPLLLAIAETRELGTEAFLTALVAGYETGARVGVALGGVPSHLHDIGNWATVGLAAGAAHLLTGGDQDVLAAAIDGAASVGLAFDRFTTVGGATLHHVYPATSALTALGVAEAATAGLTALPGSLERTYGPHFGAHFDAEKLVAGVTGGRWTQFEIVNAYYKLHPSCAHIHGTNDAVAALIVEQNLRENDIAQVRIATFGEAMEIDAEAPHNDLAARFSARATVAAAIRYGALDDEGLLDLEALEPLMARIDVAHDPSLDRHIPAGRPGRVTIETTDGRRLEKEIIHPRGTPQVPATETERLDKARTLLARAYGADGAERILSLCANLDAMPLADLSSALRA
jgi:2-methylcitrate dehydratase PrpD